MNDPLERKVWLSTLLLFASSHLVLICTPPHNTAPPLLVDDIVLDHAFAAVGIDVPEEPQFLWDGTPYMGDENRPPTFANGKVAVPQAPRFYLD